MSVVIQVDRLSKQYRLGQIGGKRLVDDVNRWWARFRGKEDPLSKVGQPKAENRKQKTEIKSDEGHDKFQLSSAREVALPISQAAFPISDLRDDTIWALKDVSFEVKQGEVLGIIGRNGAGKSTLLKILSRVTAPTSGEVRVKGRIASLLEVGTGFHPELTGRENIFLNGAILGMTKAEIRAKLDEIVDFSGVEQFIDTPVKRYSSGMTVRLAFAVAAHLEPEILIVDEVLAVGDAEFQKKCLGKMGDVAKQGRTVLFVSHNMGAVSRLCQRGLLLSNGAIDFNGTTEETIALYNSQVVERASRNALTAPHVIFDSENPNSTDTDFQITRIELLDPDCHPKPNLATWDDVVFRIWYRSRRQVRNGSVAIQLSSTDGVRLALLSTHPDGTLPLELQEGEFAVDCSIHELPLSAGKYIIGAGLAIPRVQWLCWNEELCTLTVLPRDVYGSGLAPSTERALLALHHSWRKV